MQLNSTNHPPGTYCGLMMDASVKAACNVFFPGLGKGLLDENPGMSKSLFTTPACLSLSAETQADPGEVLRSYRTKNH